MDPLSGEVSSPSPMFEIATQVLAHLPKNRRALVGIDGVDGSGKTTFAFRLAALIDRPVVLIHFDDFLNPAAVRHRRGRSSPLGFWLDTYDYVAFMREVIRPLGSGGDGRYREASLDVASDSSVRPPQRQAPLDAVVIVEGMFLHRHELAALWDFSIFLEVSFAETARRMSERDGSNPDPNHESMRRYVRGQLLYFAAAHPQDRASMVVDNMGPRPLIVGGRTMREPPLHGEGEFHRASDRTEFGHNQVP